MGTSLKKDEFVDNCSPIDDVIIFYTDGTYKVTRVQEKVFIGETERSKRETKKRAEGRKGQSSTAKKKAKQMRRSFQPTARN